MKIYGNTVAWATKKQKCVALSTAEAELIALCSSITEGLWFKKLLINFNIKVDHVFVFEANQSCISLIKNPENNRRVKHINIKYGFISDMIDKGMLKIEYVNSEDQQADMLTKGLPGPIFCKGYKALGLEI